MKFPRLGLRCAAVFITAGGLSSGQTEIGWASVAFQTNLMADGVTTFENSGQSIFFEFGTFKPDFDPSTATQAQWADNWIVLQSTAYNPIESQFIQTATLDSNSTPFFENSNAYIWGFSSVDKTSAGSQWIVMTADNWKWPAYTAGQPLTFSTGDPTVTALLGSVNYNPQGGEFHMQFAVVPEPSSSALTAAAALGLVWRRRR